MLRHRIKSLLVVAALLSSGVALGQEVKAPLGPFRPSNIRYDFEMFAPPDLSTYGNWPRPNEGFFFQYDRLYMTIQQPSRTEIGVPGGEAVGFFNGPKQFDPTQQPIDRILRPYENSLDTGFLRANETWGNRFELGFMEDDKGWFVSIFNLQDQVQSYFAGNLTDPTDPQNAGVTIVFRDPNNLLLGWVDSDDDGFDDDLNASGPISVTNRVFGVFGRPEPITGFNLDTDADGFPDAYAGFTDFGDRVPLVPLFNTISVQNVTSLAGVELNRSWRWDIMHRGGVMEWFFGVRWLLYRDRFNVSAFSDDENIFGFVGLPGDSFWNSSIDNNMFGPQIGFRYKQSLARFSLMTELRFLAAANFQSVHLDGEIASALNPIPVFPDDPPVNVPDQLVRTSFSQWQYDNTFAPVGELRVGMSYQLTRAFSVQAGYNAMLGGGISRASRRIDYVLPALKILDTNKHDAWFVNGLNIGITCNR